MPHVVVSGSFDDLRSRHIRFLQEASKFGKVHALVWSDEAIQALVGNPPKFPLAERMYTLQAIRYVDQVSWLEPPVSLDMIPDNLSQLVEVWVVDRTSNSSLKRSFCQRHGLDYRIIPDRDLYGFPEFQPETSVGESSQKKVVVTGCFDWLHSGHVRFFEEVSELGDLYVVVGHDANVRLLKGDGHPLFNQDERRYMVQSIRFVRHALISSGHGWMDGEPEIESLHPDIYAVNEDGDKPEKRAFCEQHGLEYVVFKRKPKEGLPRRESRVLRGF